MSIVWSNERVLQLIELYQNCECLWDTTHNDYKNKLIKRDAWEFISKTLDLPTKEVENKLHTLRSQFTRETKKFKSSANTESGGETVVRKIWFAYEPLKFLMKGEATSRNKDSNLTLMDENISTEETQQLIAIKEYDKELQQIQYSVENNLVEVRPKKRNNGEKLNGAYDVMIESKKRLKEKDVTDEFDVYGQYIASELRNIDEYSSLIAKKSINNILINARIGKYREYNSYGCNTAHILSLPTNYHSSLQWTNVDESSDSEQELQ